MKNKLKSFLGALILPQVLPILFLLPLIMVTTENIATAISMLLSYIVVIYLQVKWLDIKLFDHLSKKDLYKYILLGICFTIFNQILSVGSSHLISLLTSSTAAESSNQLTVESTLLASPILMAVSVGILGPICEELGFRAGLQNLFKNHKIGIFFSSLVFTLIHFLSMLVDFNVVDLLFIPVYFALGLILGIVYNKTKDIRSTIIMHAISNSLSVVLVLLGGVM